MKWLTELKLQIDPDNKEPRVLDMPAIQTAVAHLEALAPAIRRVYDHVGPPGEFGYETRQGKALAGLYDAYNNLLAGVSPGTRCTECDAPCDKRRFCDVEGCLRMPGT